MPHFIFVGGPAHSKVERVSDGSRYWEVLAPVDPVAGWRSNPSIFEDHPRHRYERRQFYIKGTRRTMEFFVHCHLNTKEAELAVNKMHDLEMEEAPQRTR